MPRGPERTSKSMFPSARAKLGEPPQHFHHSTRGVPVTKSARMLTAGPTSGGQWGLPLQGGEVPMARVGYEPESSELRCGLSGLGFFLALISGIAALITSQSQHLGRWSPPPRVVLCAGAGEGKGNPEGASSGTPHGTLPGFRSRVAPESAVGHPRSWSMATRLPLRSSR